MSAPMWMAGRTGHARRGALEHRFSYAVDYVWLDPEADGVLPALFARNRFNLAAIHDRDYGLGATKGAKWARKAARDMGFDDAGHAPLRLLTAPRLLGLGFNPVSFWVFMGEDAHAVAVIAEVNNTFGERHAYFCHAPGFAPLTGDVEPVVQKVFHVSPFQDLAGSYAFRFDLRVDRIAIRIEHRNGTGGLVAVLCGPLAPMTNRTILRALLRQPFAPMRTLALIHWQALKLWRRGAPFHRRPSPPHQEISQ